MKNKKDEKTLIINYLQTILDKVTETANIQKIANKEFLTLSETAIYLDYSENYIYQLVSKGKIKFTKPKGGKKLYFAKNDLNNFLNLKNE